MDELRQVTKFRNESGCDHLCDANELHDFGGQAERGVRVAVLKICRGLLDRSVSAGQREELKLEVEGHKWLEVHQIHGGGPYSIEINGMRRDVILAGVTVQLGDVLHGKFVPSDVMYIAHPPSIDDVKKKPQIWSTRFKLTPPLC